MPDKCNMCGVESLGSDRFAEERIPFRGSRRYCPNCHQKFYHRVYLVLFSVVILTAGIGILAGRRDIATLWLPSVLILLVVMILPHELGHGLVARALGYEQIRIFIGFGKPILIRNFFGFPFMFRMIPLGGVTLFKPGTQVHRWKHLAVVAAGPLVNVCIGAAAWFFIPTGHVFKVSFAALLLWANVLVLLENLMPFRVQTPAGVIPSDGLQLWIILFKWNKPINANSTVVSTWEKIIFHIAKWIAFVLMAGLTAVLMYATARFASNWLQVEGWTHRLWLTVPVLGIAMVSGWITYRIAISQPPKVRPQAASSGRSTIVVSPEQLKAFQEGVRAESRGDWATAERSYHGVLQMAAEKDSDAYFHFLHLKIRAQVRQGEIGRAEKTVADFLLVGPHKLRRVKILDVIASEILYVEVPSRLDVAEQCIRAALDIAPHAVTFKGTLGGILVEQGRFDEAEPFLRACCDRSRAPHDEGISTFYLGQLKLRQGKVEEGRKLIERGLMLYPQPWLVAKAKRLGFA